MPRSPKIAAEFTTTREYIARYVGALDADSLDVVTVWAMGTHTFSPACQQPATYPYLYIAGEKGSGKSVLGNEVLGDICRSHQSTVGATGAALFRMVGEYDDETGEITSMHPTLAIDEIDATYAGNKDEGLRQILNAGYKRGSSVPRAAGKTTINFPVYCPKIMMGIDNGHLPDTVADRSIRINMSKLTPDQMDSVEEHYSWDTEEEAADLYQTLSDWSKDHSTVLREYRPEKIDGLQPRQWEIARSLVQLAHEIGNETAIRAALKRLFARKPTGKDALYASVAELFTETNLDRVTTRMILARLQADKVSVPGDSGKGLAAVLVSDGITPTMLRLPKGHPGIVDNQPVQRGYYRHQFDKAIAAHTADENESE